uniref:Uroporphyrinogen-III synthase n=1 Tax=Amphimedon queenslandica TaxID=400682 RepID=A0A1X7UUP7_AMPQE
MADSWGQVVLFREKKEPVDKYEEVLKGGGFETVFIPVLSFKYTDSKTNGLLDAITSPLKYSGVIFTSQTAVNALVDMIEKEKLVIEVDKWTVVFVVGPSTKECVERQLGLQVTAGGVAGNAQLLSSIIIEYVKKAPIDKPFLFPCGNMKRDTLPVSLSENGIPLETIECYQTIQDPNIESEISNKCHKWNKGTMLVFFSPSGVQYSLPVIKQHCINIQNFTFVSIGPTTASSLISNGIPSPLVCSKPTPSDLLTLIINNSNFNNS